jgi:hypothetical protein
MCRHRICMFSKRDLRNFSQFIGHAVGLIYCAYRLVVSKLTTLQVPLNRARDFFNLCTLLYVRHSEENLNTYKLKVSVKTVRIFFMVIRLAKNR